MSALSPQVHDAGARLPGFVRWVRPPVYAAATMAFCFSIATFFSVGIAGAGAFLGAWLGGHLAQSRWRLAPLVLGPLVLCTALWLPLSWLMGGELVAGLLGPSVSFQLADALSLGLWATALSASLSAASVRVRWLGFVELLVGALAFAELVSDHRRGNINRPFEITDPILSDGGDPTVWIMAFGALAALLLICLLFRGRRLLVNLVVLLVLVLAGWWLGEESMIAPDIDPAGGLGLAGKPPPKGEQGGSGQSEANKKKSEELEFQDQQQTENDQTPMGLVLLHDDYSPPGGVYYFRQGAFSQFNGHKLVDARGAGFDEDVHNAFPTSVSEVEGAPEEGPVRVLLETTVGMIADHKSPFGLEAPISFTATRNPNPTHFQRVYRVRSQVTVGSDLELLRYDAGDPSWEQTRREHYARIPGDPRYRQLAERIMSDMGVPLSTSEPSGKGKGKGKSVVVEAPAVLRARAVTEWLGREGTYSLRSGHGEADDPTAHFLFGDLTGYCVHFAHGAVYLMRSLGLPARVATGYAVSESARRGGSRMVVRNVDAHAWPEIYLAGVGWVVMDVQPQRTLDPPAQPPDADLQKLLGLLLEGADPLTAQGARTGPGLAARMMLWLRTLGGLLLWLPLVVLILLSGAKLWRRVVPRFAGRPAARARLNYRAALDELADLGWLRRPGESREAFAERLEDSVPSLGPLTSLHIAQAYESTVFDRVALEVFGEQRRALHSELRLAVPFWRRWWGLLIPWTWLRVH